MEVNCLFIPLFKCLHTLLSLATMKDNKKSFVFDHLWGIPGGTGTNTISAKCNKWYYVNRYSLIHANEHRQGRGRVER